MVDAWQHSPAVMSIHGWVALGLGVFFSIVIGCGLMAADECLQQEGGPRHVVAQRIANTCQAWARVFDRPTLRPTFGCAPNADTYLDDAAFQPIDKGASPLGGSRTWHS